MNERATSGQLTPLCPMSGDANLPDWEAMGGLVRRRTLSAIALHFAHVADLKRSNASALSRTARVRDLASAESELDVKP